MPTKIELRSAPHRRIAVADILPNPHRDLELNPTSPERVEQLLESYERTGFWDNIVVRPHPTREDKYQLAYGHNRLAALKDKKVIADTITIPVAKLTDWEMYSAMVDENAMQGDMTPAIAMENIGVGCTLIEKALKKIGKSGTWDEFNEVLGRSVPRGTEVHSKHDGGFEKVRNAFFEGEGLGRAFLMEYLPGGKRIRSHTLSTVLNERYADSREEAKRAEAKRKEAEAKEKERQAREAESKTERDRLAAEAAAERKEAEALERAADKIGRGKIDKDILLMFETPGRMTDFAEAIRKLEIPPKHHKAAAKLVLDDKKPLMKAAIEDGLMLWWDQVSGASTARKKAAQAKADREALMKKTQGRSYIDILLKLRDSLKDEEENWKIVLAAVHIAEPKERKVIEEIAKYLKIPNELVKRSRETLGEFTEASAQKMLSHQ